MLARFLPNGLSAIRLLVAPLAAAAILEGRDGVALAVLILAGLSDLADGFVARRWGLSSRFGAWLDPIADKLLMLFCFLALLRIGAVTLWLVALVIVRDGIIGLGAALIQLLGLRRRIAPLPLGRAAMAAQLVYVGLLLLLLASGRAAPHLAAAASYAVAAFALFSIMAYGQLFLRALLFRDRTA